MAQSEDEATVGLLNAMKQLITKKGDVDDTNVEENSNTNKENSSQRSELSTTSHKAPKEADPESGVMEFSESQKSKVEKVEQIQQKVGEMRLMHL